MTLRAWAIKVGELKPLSRGGLILLGARCAIRVEAWVPPGAQSVWERALEHVVEVAFGEAEDTHTSAARARELAGRGAIAANTLAASEEVRGRCMNYAALTLAKAVEACSLEMGRALQKATVEAAKLAASIPALLAHAGLVEAGGGADPVEVASLAMWLAIRTDILSIATAAGTLEAVPHRILALRDLAPLWSGETPSWAARR